MPPRSWYAADEADTDEESALRRRGGGGAPLDPASEYCFPGVLQRASDVESGNREPHAPHVAAGISDTEAQVLAMSTVLGPATTLVRVLLGYGFISNVAKDFVPSAEAIAEARAAEDPTSSDPADADAAP